MTLTSLIPGSVSDLSFDAWPTPIVSFND
jgi:hypothetical protein